MFYSPLVGEKKMKLKGKLGILLAAVLASVSLVGGVAQAQEMKFWRIGTGGAGGTYFPIGGLIASAISNPPGSRPCDKGGSCGVPGLVAIAVSTNASVANMNAIQAGQLDAGLAGAQSVTQGYNGTGKFVGNKKDKVRVIANLYPEDMHLVLPKGTKLGSLKDLNGKRVGVAAAGSGTQVSVRQILKHYAIKATESELGLSQSTQRLADGQLDAFFYAGGTPFASLIQLGSTKGFELYKFSAAERTEINKIIPYYVESMIPAGTYESINYDVPTLAVNGQLVTSADQPDDLIYDITKALWNKNTRKLLDKGHSKGKAIRMETALKGVLIPVHPGAAKFYKEKGLL
jgi:TRAP transporter TAXI family solute receptor